MIELKTILLIEFDTEKFADLVETEIVSRFSLYVQPLKAKTPRVRLRGWQMNGEDLLSEVSRLRALNGTDYALGFSKHDLYVPDMNFVFGLASHEGRSAVVSTHRLKSSQPGAFKDRLLKEVIHELGHVFGLTHCDNVTCAMHFSNSLEDTDIKGSRFCDKCSSSLSTLI